VEDQSVIVTWKLHTWKDIVPLAFMVVGLGTVMLLVYAILVGMAIENTPWQATTTSLSLAL